MPAPTGRRRSRSRPLIPVYLTACTLITPARLRSRTSLTIWFAGFREGLRGGHGECQPMSWGTVWRLPRAGRPPIASR